MDPAVLFARDSIPVRRLVRELPGFWICERRSENSIVWITHWKYLSGILLNLYLT